MSEALRGTRFAIASSAFVRGPGVGDDGGTGGLREWRSCVAVV